MRKTSGRKTTSVITAGIATGVLVLGTPALAASAASTTDTIYVATIGETTVSTTAPITSEAQLDAFIASSTPAQVTIDPTTNTVESVVEITGAADVQGVTSGCTSGALCWQAGKTPYGNVGFSGAGTYTGAWEWRGAMKSYNWGGQLTYTINNSGASSTTDVFGPNKTVKFSNASKNNIKGLKVIVKK